MPDSVKCLLLQLPHPSYLDRNVPLAAGYLKAAAHRAGLTRDVDIQILDPAQGDWSGCQRLVDTIVSLRPDLLGFSLYLWNVDRTLALMRRVKRRLPTVTILVGGPEVTRISSYVLENPAIDVAVLGEGELTFTEILERRLDGRSRLDGVAGLAYRDNGSLVFNRPRKRLLDLELVPSPYLLGYLNPARYRELMMFTMRGCMLGCSYCAWASRGALRPFSLDRLRDELLLAKSCGEDVIVSIVDSSFNSSPVFSDFCHLVQEIDPEQQLKINCFLQADLLDQAQARLLKQSHFTGVEVGLQSIHTGVLTNVNRPIEMADFVRGINYLKAEGLPFKVDTILGLPGDSPESFQETMDFVSSQDLDPLVFTLSFGHGARIRRQAPRFGAVFQDHAPFYVLETQAFSHEALRETLNKHVEISADCDLLVNLRYPSIDPFFSASRPASREAADIGLRTDRFPITHLILDDPREVLRRKDLEGLLAEVSRRVAADLSVFCIGDWRDPGPWLALLERIVGSIGRNNPHLPWTVHLEATLGPPPIAAVEPVLALLRRPRIFLDYRDELIREDLPLVRRRATGVFVQVPIDAWAGVRDGDPCRCITGVCFGPDRDLTVRLSEAFGAPGAAILVDFGPSCDKAFVHRAMEGLREAPRQVFFKNAVWQRLWEREFLDATPGRHDHFEVLLRGREIRSKFFGEPELLWEALMAWRLVKEDCSESDLLTLVADKVAEHLAALTSAPASATIGEI